MLNSLANDDELLKCVVDSGCTCLSFGIETITKSNLQKLNKDWEDPAEYSELIQKLRNAGIDVATEMMLGLEDDTEESVRQTAKFIIDNKIEAPKLYILCPVPGTPYYDEVKDSKDLVNHDIYTYSPNKATKNTPNLSAIGSVFLKQFEVEDSARNGMSAPESLTKEPPKKLPKPTPNVVMARPVTF